MGVKLTLEETSTLRTIARFKCAGHFPEKVTNIHESLRGDARMIADAIMSGTCSDPRAQRVVDSFLRLAREDVSADGTSVVQQESEHDG